MVTKSYGLVSYLAKVNLMIFIIMYLVSEKLNRKSEDWREFAVKRLSQTLKQEKE